MIDIPVAAGPNRPCGRTPRTLLRERRARIRRRPSPLVQCPPWSGCASGFQGGDNSLAVDRYDRVSTGIIPVPKNQVAALLSVFHEPQAQELPAQLGSAQPRQLIPYSTIRNQKNPYSQNTQFSIFKSDTRWNSLPLPVTSAASRNKACTAIRRSMAPMGVPFPLRSARIRP